IHMDWNTSEINAIVDQALREDLGAGDITTGTLCAEERMASAVFIAKQEGVLAGLPLIARIFQRISAAAEVEFLAEEAQHVRKFQEICRVRGSIGALLAGERV